MGVMANRLRDVIDRMKAVDERQARLTHEMVESVRSSLDELQKSFEAEGDPKAAAIQLLREEGWTLIPPKTTDS